jgi:fructose-specific phosphotransferase system component IIB
MNLITDTFRGLVRKKLWPVALLLVAALVAVPFTLAKEPEAPFTSAQPVKKEEGLPATFVSVAEDGEVTERRRVLGVSKDPFAPAELSKKTKAVIAKAKAKAKAEKDAAKKSDSKSGSSKSGGSSDGKGSEPPASDAPAPAKTYPKNSVKVRFGLVDSELDSTVVERLAVLPSVETPVLVYRGVEEGGKVAVFELTGSVTAQGDGGCEPSPEDCQILRLRAGETQFITVTDTGTETDAQYQLDVVKIHTKPTASNSKSELTKASAESGKLATKSLSLSAKRGSL